MSIVACVVTLHFFLTSFSENKLKLWSFRVKKNLFIMFFQFDVNTTYRFKEEQRTSLKAVNMFSLYS